MSIYLEQAKKWLDSPKLDSTIRSELEKSLDDENKLKNYFYSNLSFGTAGLRGIMQPGTNGMNVHTVMQATQGLAKVIHEEKAEDRGVVISYDSRNNSRLFAEKTAGVLVANNIKVYMFNELHPVPALSFATRHFKCIAGIMITASHNPKEYNGYKVYWEDGAQVPPVPAEKIYNEIKSIDIFDDVLYVDFDKACAENKITLIKEDFDQIFLNEILKTTINKDAIKKVADTFKIVYTPLHGSGYKLVPQILKMAGAKPENILTVPEQMILDGNFPTVEKPNPELKSCFNLGIEIAKRENCDLIIGTDPDADRMGIAIKTPNGEFMTLSGNQVGALMLSYIIENSKKNNSLPKNAAAVKSIVSTQLCDRICEKNGVTSINVLTGFKFIGEKIKEFEETKEYTYIFGFEESYGYLSGTYARDKDAVFAAMLITEIAAFYRDKNMNLYDALNELFEKYGYVKDCVISIKKEGVAAKEEMMATMTKIRENLPRTINNQKVLKVRDYKLDKVTDFTSNSTTPTGLPKSDVLFFEMEDHSNLVIRPSGTEPIIKLYFDISGNNKEDCERKLEEYKKALTSLI
jgi:phosphoglucomutase